MQSIRFTFWILAVLLTAEVMAPFRTRAADKDTEMVLAELRQIQAQISQLQETQSDLEQRLHRLVTELGDEQASLRKAVVDTQTTLDNIQESISIVSSRLDETNGRLGNIRREMAGLKAQQQPILVPAPRTEGSEEDGPSTGAPKPDSPLPPPAVAVLPGPVELYQQAYTDYTHKRYALAISGFQEVYTSHPDSDLADNAHFWIGECYLAQRQYEQALKAYETLERSYPESNKMSDAKYKKALALRALGRRAEAMQVLELVLEQYPKTPVARAARQMLAELMRTQPPGR
ncbi:MAG: tol-pal system protein YbgF, partial [Acidobacteriota bacterium]